MSKEYPREEYSHVIGTTNREKILYYFNNNNRFEQSLKINQPTLYKYLTKRLKFLDMPFKKALKYYEDSILYTMYRLCSLGKYREAALYGYNNNHPLRNNQLKLIKFQPIEGLDLFDTAYFYIHGFTPKCKTCETKLKNQMYSKNNKQFCSKKCQEQDRYSWAKTRVEDNGNVFIDYNTNETTFKCACGETVVRNSSNVFTKNMFECNRCSSKYTKAHYEISDYLSGFTKVNNEAKILDNKRQSVDIELSELKVCVEYDGLMYHSYGRSTFPAMNNIDKINPKYHLDRLEELLSKNYKLLRIWEHEYIDDTKRNIWLSMLNNKMNMNTKIYARKCNLKEVDYNYVKDFCNKNHIQGSISATTHLVLEQNNEIVCYMSFGKSIRCSDDEIEIIRLCSKLNTTVIGGASKLLKYYERKYNPMKMISFANRRWSEGEIYNTLGFKFVYNTPPSYYYLRNEKKIYNRMKFTKKNIEKLFNKGVIKYFDSEKTELQNMIDNGYRIIYDCGNKKFVKQYN